MTNFFKITNSNNNTVICIGTRHNELFDLFPKSWLQKMLKFSPTHLFREHEHTEKNTQAENDTVANTSSNPVTFEIELNSSAFLQIGEFEQKFIALTLINLSDDTTEDEKANAVHDIEQLKKLYIEYVKKKPDECQLDSETSKIIFWNTDRINLKDIKFSTEIETLDNVLQSCSKLYYQDACLRKDLFEILLCYFYKDFNEERTSMDVKIIEYIHHNIPICKILPLESCENANESLREDMMTIYNEYSLKQVVHDIIDSCIVQEELLDFTCMELNPLYIKELENSQKSLKERNVIWMRELEDMIKNQDNRIVLIVGQDHLLGEFGIINAIISFPSWQGAKVEICNPDGIEYIFDPIVLTIFNYPKESQNTASISTSTKDEQKLIEKLELKKQPVQLPIVEEVILPSNINSVEINPTTYLQQLSYFEDQKDSVLENLGDTL